MEKSNPACYECPNTRSGIHTWICRDDGTAYCLKCNKELTKPQADHYYEPGAYGVCKRCGQEKH